MSTFRENRFIRHTLLALLSIVCVVSLAGCSNPISAFYSSQTQSNQANQTAVGHSYTLKQKSGATQYDGEDCSDLVIGVVSSSAKSGEKATMDSLAAAIQNRGIKTLVAHGDTSSAQIQSVRDFVNREVFAIVVHPDAFESSESSGSSNSRLSQLSRLSRRWSTALQEARNAGIPVLIVNSSVKQLSRAKISHTLYAGIWNITIKNQSKDASHKTASSVSGKNNSNSNSKKQLSVDTVLFNVIDDRPHSTVMMSSIELESD